MAGNLAASIRRPLVAVTLVLFCLLCGHDSLMIAQAQTAHRDAHHATAAAESGNSTPADHHEAPAPHPETCGTSLRAVPQPTEAPPPSALPNVLSVREASEVAQRVNPLLLQNEPQQAASARRAMLQVYRV